MRRAIVVFGVLCVGVLLGAVGSTPQAPSICGFAVDMDSGTVEVFAAVVCPDDPVASANAFVTARTRVPVCMQWTVFTSARGIGLYHPCKGKE